MFDKINSSIDFLAGNTLTKITLSGLIILVNTGVLVRGRILEPLSGFWQALNMISNGQMTFPFLGNVILKT